MRARKLRNFWHVFVCEAAADVRVRVRRSVVDVQIEQASLRAVVPIATVISSCPITTICLLHDFPVASLLLASLSAFSAFSRSDSKRIQPPTDLPTALTNAIQ